MNGFMHLIANGWEWTAEGLMLAVCAAAWAGLLAIVVLVMNVLFRRWLSACQWGCLWGLVLLRLLIPIAPSAPSSFQNLIPSAPTESTSRTEWADESVVWAAQHGAQPPASIQTAADPDSIAALQAARPEGVVGQTLFFVFCSA